MVSDCAAEEWFDSGCMARKQSTGFLPPSQALVLWSSQSLQVGTWDTSTRGKCAVQSVASILPLLRNFRTCRAVYFMSKDGPLRTISVCNGEQLNGVGLVGDDKRII